MKSFTLLALLLASPAFAGTVLDSVQTDLDGDGQADLAQNVDNGGTYSDLEITLSKTGRKITQASLFRKFAGDTCSEMGSNKLMVGPSGTLLWASTEGAMDACQSERNVTFRIALVSDTLKLLSAKLNTDEWHMGDRSPLEATEIDFIAKTISVDIRENHGSKFHAHKKEAFSKACVPSIAELQGGQLPLCIAQQDYYMAQELYLPGRSGPAAICPDLNGAYQCTEILSNGYVVQEQLLSIHRFVGKYNQYDLSTGNLLLADGKEHRLESDSNNQFQTVLCARENLQIHKTVWVNLLPGDKRKPLFDRLPYTKETTRYTQLDLFGDHFTVSTTLQYLDDSGHYLAPSLTTKDCARLPRP